MIVKCGAGVPLLSSIAKQRIHCLLQRCAESKVLVLTARCWSAEGEEVMEDVEAEAEAAADEAMDGDHTEEEGGGTAQTLSNPVSYVADVYKLGVE